MRTLALILALAAASCGGGVDDYDAEQNGEANSGAGEMTEVQIDRPDLRIENAFVRAPIGGRDVTAAYLTLRSAEDDALTAATSDHAEVMELHTHRDNNGQMMMVRVPEIPLPAGEVVVLEPGGLHLMLFGVDPDLAPGTDVTLTLTFESGRSETITAPVRGLGG